METLKWILKNEGPSVLTPFQSNGIASKENPFLVVRRTQEEG